MSKREQLFIMLNLIDFSTTNLLLSLGGEEIMPVGVAVITAFGMPGLLLYKLAVTLCVIYLFRILKSRDKLWDLLNGAFAGIVTWNNVGIAASIITELN